MKKKVILATLTTVVCALPVSWGEEKVTICHFPPGNPANVQILTIGASAVPHHVGNHPGDRPTVGSGDRCVSTTQSPPGNSESPQ